MAVESQHSGCREFRALGAPTLPDTADTPRTTVSSFPEKSYFALPTFRVQTVIYVAYICLLRCVKVLVEREYGDNKVLVAR